MKLITKKTLENGIKSLCFVLAAAFILMLISICDVYRVHAQTWYLILLLAGIDLVQWAAVVIAVQLRSDDIGEVCHLTRNEKLLLAVPGAALFVLLIILYAALGGRTEFFALEGKNVFISLLILLIGVGLCYLFDYAYVTATKKNQIHTTTVKIVQKEKRSRKKDSEPSPEEKKIRDIDPDSTVFPDLITIDREMMSSPYVPALSAQVGLKELCDGFNRYLESNGMFYTMENIRAFVSGLACSRFLILEGLSGTGKTSLPKFFAEYIGCDICFTSVQASWKDRSDVLGYYNDFVHKFKETPFLRALYSASYRTDEVNLMVLDEMNLSRIEYYFADFLSVLELDESQWKIELMPVSTGGVMPLKLDEGSVVIPDNVWFIGTANKDDSTFTITDKVYDRAVIIDFSQRNESNTLEKQIPAIHLGADALQALFAQALKRTEGWLSRADYERFSELTDFVLDAFDVNFGNRILNQITRFVPVYIACGGTAAKALDLMFARKVLRKLDGRFDDGIKANLVKLEKLVLQQYGKAEFSATLEAIAKLKRKLI